MSGLRGPGDDRPQQRSALTSGRESRCLDLLPLVPLSDFRIIVQGELVFIRTDYLYCFCFLTCYLDFGAL